MEPAPQTFPVLPRSTLEAYLREVSALTSGYSPRGKTARYSGGLAITAVMGPSGSGKTTLFEASGVAVALGVTSREPRRERGERDGVGFRRYLNLHSPDVRAEILRKLRRGDYIQAADPLVNGNFYGSESADYPEPVMGMNALTREYFRLRGNNPFARLTGVFVTPESFDAWQTRWMARSPDVPADYGKRMHEARDSLELALDDHELQFILNADGKQQDAANLIHEIAHGYRIPLDEQTAARNAAAGILQEIIARA